MIKNLAPVIGLSVGPALIMLVIAWCRRHWVAALLSASCLTLALMLLPGAYGNRPLTPLLLLDAYAVYYSALILIASLVVVGFAYHYFSRAVSLPEEFYVLLLTAALGSVVLTASNHFASLFLGLEVLSISLYAMIGYTRSRAISTEAAIKYLVPAAGSSAFLVFGMALVYARLGSMEFPRVAALALVAADTLLFVGFGLMMVGLGFKLAVAPFHLWTPDVYEGAPAPVTAFIATASKGAVFALLLRFFTLVDVDAMRIYYAFAAIAAGSMIVGNLLALLQTNVKRLLAYSSIAHLGYLLVAFLAFGQNGLAAAAFYLAAYIVTTLGAFGVVTALSTPQRDADQFRDYRGLMWRRPWLAGIFTLMLLSLAGIPLTAGFIGKIYLVTAAEHSSSWALVITLVLTSGVGLFYYLRVIVQMLEREAPMVRFAPQWLTPAILVLLTAVLLWMGLYPTPFFALVSNMATFR